jgi:hypothetical protein
MNNKRKMKKKKLAIVILNKSPFSAWQSSSSASAWQA